MDQRRNKLTVRDGPQQCVAYTIAKRVDRGFRPVPLDDDQDGGRQFFAFVERLAHPLPGRFGINQDQHMKSASPRELSRLLDVPHTLNQQEVP